MKFIVLITILLSFAIYAQEQDTAVTEEQQIKKDTKDIVKKETIKDTSIKNDKNKESKKAPEESQDKKIITKPKARQSITIIGKLRRTKPLTLKKPSEYVLEDEYLYKSTDYYLGNLFLYSRKKRDLSDLEGKVVVVNGYLDKDLNKIIEKISECPEDYGQKESMMQIRDDWVNEETGFSIGRSTTEKLRNVPFLRYYRVKKCKSFRVKKYFENEKVEIVFHNELRKSIADVKLTAHYESVFGKPVPMYQDKKIKNLHPGDKASFVIPMTISSIKKYRLHAVKVYADNGNFQINITEYIETR